MYLIALAKFWNHLPSFGTTTVSHAVLILNVLHAARWKCRTQKIAKSAPSGHRRTAVADDIFATKARIDNLKKNVQYLLQMSSQ